MAGKWVGQRFSNWTIYYIAALRRSKAVSSGLPSGAFANEEQLLAVDLFFGLKEKNPKQGQVLAGQAEIAC
jgi:hypothetical protein